MEELRHLVHGVVGRRSGEGNNATGLRAFMTITCCVYGVSGY